MKKYIRGSLIHCVRGGTKYVFKRDLFECRQALTHRASATDHCLGGDGAYEGWKIGS